MTPTLTSRSPQVASPRRPSHAVAAAAAMLVLLALSALVRDTPHVPAVSIENSTDADVTVTLRGASGGETSLGRVGPRQRRAFSEVVDVGATWVVRFRPVGGEPVDVTVSRQQLEATRWTVSVPVP